MSVDPRLYVIPLRLSIFKYIIPVVSPKGGVGKTTISTALSLVLAYTGEGASLLDLDLNNPTAHIVLGLDIVKTAVAEDKGVLPVRLADGRLEFMSISLFVKDRLLPLRGRDTSNAIREIFAVTRWSKPVLIIDTPPGFSDEVMELLRLCPTARPLLVTTPDGISIASVKRVLEILRDEGIEMLGVVGNMCRRLDDMVKLRERLGIDIATCVPYVDGIENLYGNPRELVNIFRRSLSPVVEILLRGVQ